MLVPQGQRVAWQGFRPVKVAELKERQEAEPRLLRATA